MADTLTDMSLLIALIAVLAAAILFMVEDVRKNNRKRDRAMEAFSVSHARQMNHFGSDADASITYIMPKERNLWEKLTRRVGVWAWGCDFADGDSSQCRFYKPITTSAYFYMQLKGWTETSDKELAQKALDYMKWEREIP